MARFLVLLLVLLPLPCTGGEIPEATIVLESLSPALPGDVPDSAPPIFVLLKDGQLFRGGSGRVLSGKIEGNESSDLEKQVARVRKLPGLGPKVTLGPGPGRLRLTLKEGRRLEIVAEGDPASAPAGLRPLASLLQTLLSFDHPSLRPYAPASYVVRVMEGHLPGGCRPWVFPIAFADAIAGPRLLPALSAEGWPTGEQPSSLCVGDKNYIMTLRPLLPGEHP
jgi:hypothetical protein